jgi:O-antigen/teichoic acid export membrane protein
MPFLVHNLGDDVYGVWVLVLSFTGYMWILDFGIRTTITKYVSEYRAKKEYEYLNKIISSSLFMFMGIGAITILVSIICACYLDKFVSIDPSLVMDAKIAMVIVGVNTALFFVFGVFSGIISGEQRHDLSSNIEIVSLTLKTLLIVIFVKLGYGIVALGAVTLLATIGSQIVLQIYAKKIYPQLRISYKLISLDIYKKIFGYSIYAFIVSVSAKIINQTDNVVIGIFLGPAWVTLYSVGARLSIYSRQLIQIMSGVLMPTISEFQAKEENHNIQRILILGTKYSYMILLPIFMIFLFMGQDIILFWIGRKYISEGFPVAILLMMPHLLAPSEYIMKSLLFGIGRLKAVTIAALIEAAANLVLSIIFVRKIGLIGVALGTLIPLVINKGIFMPIYVSRIIKQPLLELFHKSLFKPTIAIFPCMGVLWLLRIFCYPSNFIMLFMQASLCFLIYFVVCYYYAFDRRERDIYRSKYNDIIKSLAKNLGSREQGRKFIK